MKENKVLYQDNLITKFLIESHKYGDKECIIDTEDWNRVKKNHWSIYYDRFNFYVITNIKIEKNKRIIKRLHRVIMNLTDSIIDVDHIDHNTFNNKKENLRICKHEDNLKNRTMFKKNKFGYKCVFQGNGKWRSYIRINGKQVYLGYFENIKDAAIAYNNAAKKYYKDFACLNKL